MKIAAVHPLGRAWCCCAPIVALACGPTAIGADSTDKSAYHLFNPTPADQLRDLSTDRPDATESPYTVDAGRIQVELSFFDLSVDRWNDEGQNVTTLTFAPVLVKLGLTHDMDLQIGLDPHINERARSRTTGATSTSDGIGDLTVRLKVNIWGNDDATEGATALGIMPFITIPTASDGLGVDDVEGGIIVPFATNLTPNLSFGAMAELDLVRDAEDDGYTIAFVHTATLSTELFASVGGFIEYAGTADLEGNDDYVASFNTGLTHAINSNTQLDLGVRLGLTKDSEDFGLFAGISLRL